MRRDSKLAQRTCFDAPFGRLGEPAQEARWMESRQIPAAVPALSSSVPASADAELGVRRPLDTLCR